MSALGWDPNQDGLTHINVYSRGLTVIGRFLSNFTFAPFVHPLDGRFASVEGYWYWLAVKPTHPRRDELRYAHGYAAKTLGRMFRGADWPTLPDFQDRICMALRAKLGAYPDFLMLFRQPPHLPLAHYYVFDGMTRAVPEAQWMLDELDKIRRGE